MAQSANNSHQQAAAGSYPPAGVAVGQQNNYFWQSVRAAGTTLVDTKTYTKATVTVLVLLLAAFLLRSLLAVGYTRYVVTPILSKVTLSRGSDQVLGLAVLVGILIFWAQARLAYRPGLRQLTLCTLPGALYLWVRAHEGQLWDQHWCFTPFRTVPGLHYADTLVLPLVGGWLLWGWARWQARQRPATGRSYLESDDPSATPDRLGRGPEARRLAEQLAALRLSSAFVVGIVGQWGTGKTKFLELMQGGLPAAAIVIRFNPWLVESTAAIRKEFFATFKERLGQYSGELAAELGTYANGLAGVYDTTAAKAFKETVTFLTDTPTLTEQFNKVNQVIGHLNRPIFVFLDDVDRLDKDEVLETLRLVRNTASFQRTIFVLAYDKQYVLEAVRLTNQANSSQYLDKIVQLEVPLPSYSRSLLAERTLELVLPAVPEAHRAELAALLGESSAERPGRQLASFFASAAAPAVPRTCYFPELISTMRGAVRFANLLTFDLLPLAEEVRLDELLNLTLLKLRFPTLYEAIKTQRVLDNDFTRAFSTGGAVLTLNEARLTQFYEEFKWPLPDQELGRRVVQELFGRTELEAGERTIQQPAAFDIYFSAGRLTDVSLAVIARLRTGPAADIDTYLGRWQDAGQLEAALDKLEAIEVFNDRHDFENVVTAVLHAGRRSGRSVWNWLLRLNATHEQLARQFYANPPALAAWLESLLAAAPAPYLYEANLVDNLRAHTRYHPIFSFLLSDTVLARLVLGYLRDYLASHSSVDQAMFTLHLKNTEGAAGGKVIIAPAANQALRRAIEDNSASALRVLQGPAPGPNGEAYQTFQPLLDQIFGSWDAVEEFIGQLAPSAESRRVQQDFACFRAAGHQPFAGSLVT